jgi:hypothetical protein
MSETKEYIEKLKEVSIILKPYFERVVVNENGVNSFINALKNDLEVEIYRSKGLIAVDLWKGEDEFEELEERDFESYEEALKLVLEWLKKYEKYFTFIVDIIGFTVFFGCAIKD